MKEAEDKLKALIAHHDAQKKAELLAGLPERVEYADHGAMLTGMPSEVVGFNRCVSQARAAIEAVYGE
jgi:hypothetical protein